MTKSRYMSGNMVSVVALMAALGLSVPAYASDQEGTAPDPAEQSTQMEQAPAEPSQETPADQAAADEAQDNPAADEEQNASTRTEAPVDGQIVLQDEDTFLVSALLGASVENSAGEIIGDINDVLSSRDGTFEGVVIGVGGFLGIGEKDVAIEYDRLQLVEKDGSLTLMLDVTPEDLEQAPEFVSAEAQQLEEQRQMIERERERVNRDMQAPMQPQPGAEQPSDQGTDTTE